MLKFSVAFRMLLLKKLLHKKCYYILLFKIGVSVTVLAGKVINTKCMQKELKTFLSMYLHMLQGNSKMFCVLTTS